MAQENASSGSLVLYISSSIVLLFVALGMFLPAQTAAVVNKVFAFLTTDFGWLYLLSVAVFLVVAYGIAFSRYGNIKLGKDEDTPEFSNFQWFAMLFGGGMGIGLVFWSIAEPIMHYLAPPVGTASTPEAMATAMPSGVYATLMPRSLSGAPSQPVGASRLASAMPATAVGRAKGKSTRASSTRRPGKR